MPRKLTPKKQDKTAAEERVLQRQQIILKLYRRGITETQSILEYLREHGRRLKEQGKIRDASAWDVTDRTLRTDRAAVLHVLKEAYAEDVVLTKETTFAQLDDLAMQLQSIADKTKDGDDKRPAISALDKKHGVLVTKAKLTGALVERVETKNETDLRVEASPDQVAELQRALSHSRTEV